MKKLTWLIILCALFAMSLTACRRASIELNRGEDARQTASEGASGENEAAATPQPTLPAPVGTIVLAEGQVVAVNPALPLSFAASGRLLTIEVSPGDRVAAGDLIATLDDESLRAAITSAEMQVAVAENSLAQARLSLDTLLDWQVDETAVALAEANLAAAEASYEAAQAVDASAGNSLTAARISVEQAQRRLADAREAHETAFDPGREWELQLAEPTCLPGQGGAIPCTGPLFSAKMEAERAAAERAVTSAQEGLAIAQANYNLAISSLNDDSALQAAAAVASARQALSQAQAGPKSTEIDAAELRVEQAELARQQAEFSLDQARRSLENANLYAPWSGEVLTVDAAPGSLVGSGLAIITLIDSQHLQFHTSNLSERDLSQITPGQPVEISLRAYPGQVVDGVVTRIEPRANGLVGDAAAFTVVIDFEHNDLLLLSGMTGRAEIQAAPASAH